jgi:acetyl-CoA carboxylase biotin carboxylase subunit
MIKRVLVANRGEVALRIIRACRELGMESVAVYSDADRGAPHVAAADRALAIGPAPAAESYLSTSRLLEAAREGGADAVHPGYGFLSENAAFAAACEQAGLVFVGPPSQVIAKMGSKIDARRVMHAAGLPVVPGETPEDQTDSGVRRAVDRVGLPAIIKASAGGGGKGMRRVRHADEIADAIQAARREATASFGDGTLYVERLVERPRHVEVQVFADDHGSVMHLFERECSVQRRHQKIIEESPSPGLTPALRVRMTAAAVQAARAAAYRNAGTVEFLVEGSGNDACFYFLEMNTRLQVEHPVTEQVTGLDLVRAQLLVAAGHRVPWNQDAVAQRGHAVEARVYAEDPSQGFVPQAGPLLLYREPRLPGVRIDSGVAEGGDVSVYYDPMIAKVIASGETREVAIARLASGLRDFPILGIRTNIPFLLRILEHPRFQAGTVDTGFLEGDGAALADAADLEMPAFVRAALAAAAADESRSPTESRILPESQIPNPESRETWDPWRRLRDWRL